MVSDGTGNTLVPVADIVDLEALDYYFDNHYVKFYFAFAHACHMTRVKKFWDSNGSPAVRKAFAAKTMAARILLRKHTPALLLNGFTEPPLIKEPYARKFEETRLG